jgi:hypothetical protein
MRSKNIPKLGFLVWKYTIWQPCSWAMSQYFGLNFCRTQFDANILRSGWWIVKLLYLCTYACTYVVSCVIHLSGYRYA